MQKRITEWLVSSYTSLDLAAYKNNIFSSLVKSSLVKLETSCTVILPPMVSVLRLNVTSLASTLKRQIFNFCVTYLWH